MSLDANALRSTYLNFFAQRGHTIVPSSSLVLTHPTAPMFANAGMNQFVEYLAGEVPAPYRAAASSQKCVRLSGKHNDISELGKTRRHMSFFEMLGNWSFNDYFKDEAIAMAWEFLTEEVGLDGDRLWITVHVTDDEAEQIWIDKIGVPPERIQRLDKDNFWEMGDTGPCGPCSEIHFDCGPKWGDAGGPAHGGGDRYVEFWNLVFMDKFRHADGSVTELPFKNIDTGAGLERWLMLIHDLPTVFDTDAIRPLIGAAESITGKRYRADDADERVDTALRIIGDHARTMTFIVNDGVTPSNEGRGYVLRGVIRRAVRLAYQLGVDRPMCSGLVAATVDLMGDAYPELRRNESVITDVIDREEMRFRTTLRSGSLLLEEELAKGRVTGATAFKLHDTYGFPIEITEEIAEERGAPIDRTGFDELMTKQREQSRAAAKTAVIDATGVEGYRKIVDATGLTEFTGYTEYESSASVVAILDSTPGGGQYEVFLDRTPFYAEGGGQVGDTGTITSETGTLLVIDTTYAVAGLHRHVAQTVEGDVTPGQQVTASIDRERRDAIRRNHTGTHILHWALREVLGQHVRQHGSLVAPDYLRFDFSHHSAVSQAEIEEIEKLANERILDNEPVRAYETPMEHAKELGAIMFFGDKYGDVVRVVEAGHKSMELCGGTHVNALGMIGPIKITQETSIGANLRRVFALTGSGTLEWVSGRERLLANAASLTRTKPEDVPAAIERLLERQKGLEDEVKATRAQLAAGEGKALASEAVDGFVVLRRDTASADELRDLAASIRTEPGIKAAVLVGSPDGERVSLVAAVSKDSGLVAGQLIADAAKITGGGGNAKAPDLAVAGGKDVSRIDDALTAIRTTLGIG